ncbi:MAG: hypothetical protein ACRDVM_06015 [Acidimicrobiia bacterium]
MLDTTSSARSPAPRWIAGLIVGATALLILAVMNPRLLLVANTPTGGDMGAHVLGPAFLRDVLLPSGQVMGWSNSWFAGFPIFYFYFPLPSLVIVALDLVLPYGVAFKLVTVAGLVAMPFAAYYLVRSLRFGPNVAAVAGAAGGSFVFMESYSIYGANIASTLAGEFSFSWSFALSLVYLGLLIQATRDDRKYLKWAALALAATALSHVLTTIVIVLASLPVLLWRRGPRTALTVWAWGFAIAAFWAVPLVARIGLTSDMAWTPLRGWDDILPIEIWLLLPAALVGMVWAVLRTPRAVPVIMFTLLPLIYYPLPTLLPRLLPDLFVGERWKLWNGRLLPYWYFGVALFAGMAVGLVGTAWARRLPERVSAWWPRAAALGAGAAAVAVMASGELPDWVPWLAAVVVVAGIGLSLLWREPVAARAVVAVTAGGVLALGGLAGVTFVDGWARWNYEGYEGKPKWPQYQALMATMGKLPPGRVQWEANNEALNQYGTPMSPMLFPYWTEGTHPSMEGLFFESSITTPFHFLNTGEMSLKPSNPIPGLSYHTFDFERGLPHLDVYGVRYYVSVTEEATTEARQRPELTQVAASPPFTIFELPESPLVEVADFLPAVYEAPPSGPAGRVAAFVDRLSSSEAAQRPTFHEMALDWYDDLALLDRWMVADGPPAWPRIDQVSALRATPAVNGGGSVSEVEITDERVSFTTTAVGVPHLVKVSYFPNWQAEGADGPYRAAPSLMVVVPDQERVTLEFRNTWAENLGLVLTVGSLGVLALPGLRRRNGP